MMKNKHIVVENRATIALGLKIIIIMMFSIPLFSSAMAVEQWTSNLNNNISAYWKMDENTSTITLDSVASLNNGTFDGAGVHWRGGIINSSLKTDSGYYVSLGNGAGTQLSGEFTLAGWIKMDSNSVGTEQDLYFPVTPTNGLGLGIRPSSHYLRLTKVGVSAADSSDGVPGLLTDWHFVAVTRTGTTARFYVDGSQLGTDQTFADDGVASTYGFAPSSDWGNCIDCYFDEWGKWSRALNSSEISQLYNGGSGLQFNNSGSAPAAPPSVPDNFTENSATYNPITYETANENFILNLTYNSTRWGLAVNLSYANSQYIGIISGTGNTRLVTNTIPVPISSVADQNNTFYWRVFLTNSTGTYEFDTVWRNQTVLQPSIQSCTQDRNITALNFTMWDEINGTQINPNNAPITFQATFNYYFSGSNIYKNYSYQNLSANLSNIAFCLYPYVANLTFKVDMDSIYSAAGYSQNYYYLRNTTLTNITSNIKLYLIPTALSTKFYITVQNGVTPMQNTLVLVTKQDIGTGTYQTTSSQLTDDIGQFPIYMDLDKNYRFYIIQNGISYGYIDKKASCSAAPCTLTLQVNPSQGNIFQSYTDEYAVNILSNLTFDSTTKIVTYSFVDTTGLARYFRLYVYKPINNESGSETICNDFVYSASGVMTCNLTGQTGDFFATTYISRSPEKVDKTISIIINAFIAAGNVSTGLMMIFFCIGIIVTVVFAVAVTSRGNPASIIFAFGIAVLATKIINIFPFGWIVVSLIELLVILMLGWTKT